MTQLTARQWNGIGFLVCAGLMGYALYAQYVQGLPPCPLCVFQRVAVIALGGVFLLAAIHNPDSWGRGVYGGLALLSGAAGAAVAGRHAYLQSLPPDQVPECGPGLDYIMDVFPLADALRMVFTGSGECAEVQWSFLGLSMPAWVLVWCAALSLGAIAINIWPRARLAQS